MGRTGRQTGTLLGHNHFVSALSLDEDLRLVIASCDLFFFCQRPLTILAQTEFGNSQLGSFIFYIIFYRAINPIICSTESFFPSLGNGQLGSHAAHLAPSRRWYKLKKVGISVLS